MVGKQQKPVLVQHYAFYVVCIPNQVNHGEASASQYEHLSLYGQDTELRGLTISE
jgi:hypothetical protein